MIFLLMGKIMTGDIHMTGEDRLAVILVHQVVVGHTIAVQVTILLPQGGAAIRGTHLCFIYTKGTKWAGWGRVTCYTTGHFV